jgi:DNA-directed RNA polymerase specialized sigma54-like protein
MGTLEIQQVQSVQARQELRSIMRLEQAKLLEMPEEDFNKLSAEIENSPLFKNLYRKEKVIRYHRYPKTDISARFCELNEGIAAGSMGALDIESLLSSREEIVRHIQKIGLERFKHYFLYPEPGVSAHEIARECDLDIPAVEKIDSLINDFSVMSEFYHPSVLDSGQGIHYSKIASIGRGPEGFVIGYFSPSYARGKYSVDYERFEELKENGTFSAAEAKEIRQLFKKLELINSRKDTVTRILRGIVEKQALYFESGNGKALLPFSQKELAGRIDIAPSSISRAISGKSLETPLGEEKALRDFFPGPRMFKKELVRQLFATGEEFPSDEAVKARLQQEFGVSISRRSVANLREELKIAAAWKRKKTVMQ